MNNGEHIASPIFKKRFARRTTTHRPFTFAQNFEIAESSAKQVVEKVGDRGLVIRSPVQLSAAGKEALSLADVVQHSPVPVILAHSSPPDKEKANTEQQDVEEEEINSSQRRRSGRQREPSQLFLGRLQHPHCTPQLSGIHGTPPTHSRSQKTSTIDAEVSFTEEDSNKRSKTKSVTSSGRSSRQANRSRAVASGSRREATAASSEQGSDGDAAGSSRTQSAGKGEGRKREAAVTERSSNRRGRGQAALKKTPSSHPSLQTTATQGSSKGKKSAPKYITPTSASDWGKGTVLSPLPLQLNKDESVSESRKMLPQEGKGKAATAASVKRTMKTRPSQSDESQTDLTAKRSRQRGPDKAVDESMSVSASASILSRLPVSCTSKKKTSVAAKTASAVSEIVKASATSLHEKGVKDPSSSRDDTRISGSTDNSKNNSADLPPVSSAGRKQMLSENKESGRIDPVRTARKANITEVSRASRKTVKQPHIFSPDSSDSRSKQRTKKIPQDNNSLHTSSVLGSSSKTTAITQSQRWQRDSPKHYTGTVPGDLSKHVADNTSAVLKSSQKRLSNSFWKTPHQMSSGRRTRPKLNVSADSDSDHYSTGGMEKNSSAARPEMKRKRGSRPGPRQDNGDATAKGNNSKRQKKSVTEIAVINDMLSETKEDIMQSSGMSQTCARVVHKVLTFTTKQLQQTEVQVLEIKNLTSQINKLKSICKSMSNDSKENMEQKVILQNELHSLQQEGVDADMICIDEWMQGFKALQHAAPS